MTVALRYRRFSEGDWKFAVLSEEWTRELHDRVLDLVERQPPSKRPQTMELPHADAKQGERLYLKVFHQAPGMANLKDLFRQSKALRSLRQGEALSAAGFDVPTTIAAGENRRFRILRRAFVLTRGIRGSPAPVFLRDCSLSDGSPLPLAEKRNAIRRLAEQVARFHRLGFVHGDLVPSNILVSMVEGAGLRLFFMDNDRTRRYPRWLPQSIWKRNLIQLNRLPLPGISLQDRMRFFRSYFGDKDLGPVDLRFLRWLEVKTRQRRRECDSVDATGDFRKLMRWEDKTRNAASYCSL